MIKFLKNQDIQVTTFSVAKTKVANNIFSDLLLLSDGTYNFPLVIPIAECDYNFNYLDTGSFAHGQTYVALSRATSLEGIYLMREINSGDLIFDKKVFNFLGTKLEKKYVDEIKNFKEKKITYKKAKETDVKVISSDWTHEEEQKLINFYKKNVPEIVLSKIFKRSMNEIREKILKLLKLN